MARRKTEQEIVSLVGLKNGKIIDFEYKDYRSIIHVLCDNGHEFSTSYDSLRKGCWCGICSGTIKHDIEYANGLAIKNGGICTSVIYKNNRSKLRWRCKFGHEWQARLGDIKRGRWCPICSSGRSEEICRFAFECVFGMQFPKTRPSWLISDSNTRLELDGYCKELSIAFEHHGLQHYQKVDFFNKTRSFDLIAQSDSIKIELCKAHGIRLIEIPQIYTITSIESLVSLVNSIAEEYGFVSKDIDFSKLFNYKYQKVIDVSKTLGLKCLSKEYIGAFDPMYWQCNCCRHRFYRPPVSIVHFKRKCPKCQLISRLKGRIYDMIELAKSKGGKCLSDKYIRSDEKLMWMCANGHVWKSVPANVKRGNWCQKCHLENLRKINEES